MMKILTQTGNIERGNASKVRKEEEEMKRKRKNGKQEERKRRDVEGEGGRREREREREREKKLEGGSEGDYLTCRKRMYWGNLWIGLRRRPCRLRLWLYFPRRNVTNFGWSCWGCLRFADRCLLTYRL